MLAREGFIFRSLLFVFDAVVVVGAFLAAHAIRFASPSFIAFEHTPDASETATMLLFVVVSMLIALRLGRLYDVNPAERWGDEAFRLAKAFALGLLILTAATYFLRQEKYSRLTLAIFFGLAALILMLARHRFRRWLRRSLYDRVTRRGVLVVGEGELAERVAQAIRTHREYGLEFVDFVQRSEYESVRERLKATRAQLVIVALPLHEQNHLTCILDLLCDEPIEIQVVPDLLRYATVRGGPTAIVEEFAGMPMVSLQASPFGARERVLKRSFDIVTSFVGLVVVSPALLLCLLLVKFTSRGPVFFKQERMGLDGRTFEMFKFRTMRENAETGTGAIWSPRGDARATPVGAFLRRLSLDELPQLLNVLMGDMSLVGPRPERPVFITEFRAKYPRYNLRHMVKAGITGWAQVNGWRGSTSLEKRIEYDLFYIENWSLAFDIKILLKTVAGGFFNRSA